MAKGKKRRRTEHSREANDDDSFPEEEEEEEEEEEGDQGGGAFEEISVDFEFYDPQDVDFHGLRALLGSYLNEQSFDLSELVETIIAQKTVGTVIKTSEDSVDPIGVATVLNLQQHKGLQCLQQVRAFLLSKCSDSKQRAELTQAWSSEGTGLIVSERLINVPPQISPPLMQALFDEISWATEDEPTQELRDCFKFKQYIILTRVYAEPAAPKAGSSTSAGQSSKKSKGSEPVLVFVRPEDELFHQRCTWSLSFSVEGKDVGKDELKPWRMAMVVPASAVVGLVASLEAVIQGNT